MTIPGDFLEIRGFLVFEDDPPSLANPDSKLEWQDLIEILKKVESGLSLFYWLYFENDL